MGKTGFEPERRSRRTSNRARSKDRRPQLALAPEHYRLGMLVIVVSAITLTAHWPALSAQAHYLDDSRYVTDTPAIRKPDWAAVGRVLSEIMKPSVVTGYYHPLSVLSIMLDHARGGSAENLQPFHQTSLALHTANTALMMVLFYLLFRQPWAATAAGLLFGVHPITVEAIPWVAERKTVLAAFFALFALVCYVLYVRRGGWKLYGACLLLYGLALLSKPTSLPLPALMLTLDWQPLARLNRRALLEKAPFFVLGGLSAIITFLSQQNTEAVIMPNERPWLYTPLLAAYNFFFYPAKIFWPVPVSPYYPFPVPFAISNPEVLISVIGAGMLLAALLLSLRWTRAWLAGGLFFFLAILPALGIIGFTHTIAADRFAYLPILGLLIPVAWLLSRLQLSPFPKKVSSNSLPGGTHTLKGASLKDAVGEHWRTLSNGAVRWARLGQAGMLVIMLVAGLEIIATRNYLAYWQTTESLYRYALVLAPNVGPLRLDLGLELFHQGKLDEARLQEQAAIALDPADPRGYHNLGLVLAQQGQTEAAIDQYEAALRIDPNYANAHINLGFTLTTQGNYEAAIGHYQAALRIDPNNGETRNKLAVALAQQGRLAEAVQELQAALQVEPDNVGAHFNLGLVLELQGRRAEAIVEYREALRLDPANAEIQARLNAALARESSGP